MLSKLEIYLTSNLQCFGINITCKNDLKWAKSVLGKSYKQLNTIGCKRGSYHLRGGIERMSRAKEILLDTVLIFAGMGLSVLFVSTDGNGQNPLPVAAEMSVLMAIIAVVSFFFAWVIQSRVFAVFVTIIVIELLFALFSFRAVASSSDAAEILYLLPVVLVAYTLPMVLLTSIGFIRLASSLYRRKVNPVMNNREIMTAPPN